MQSRVHRAYGAIQRQRRFRITHLLKIAQHDHLAVARRQGQDGLSHQSIRLIARAIAERVVAGDQLRDLNRLAIVRFFNELDVRTLLFNQEQDLIAGGPA